MNNWREKKQRKPSKADATQKRVTEAATDAVIQVLKPIKHRTIDTLVREEIDRVSVAAIGAFTKARGVELLREELNDELPEVV